MKRALILIIGLLFYINSSAQSTEIFIYGPGGPSKAVIDAAKNFEEIHQVKVNIISGSFGNWQRKASLNADIIYSGSEHMMTDFINYFPENFIVPSSVFPLYFRKLGLIVRKGNPLRVKSIKDLQTPSIKIMVVNGSGLIGAWEDMLGKLNDVKSFRNIRKNIVYFAPNSRLAEKEWTKGNVDIWITWNIWQVRNSSNSEFITVPRKYAVIRDMGISLTERGEKNKNAILFYNYLKSKSAKPFFKSNGWQ